MLVWISLAQLFWIFCHQIVVPFATSRTEELLFSDKKGKRGNYKYATIHLNLKWWHIANLNPKCMELVSKLVFSILLNKYFLHFSKGFEELKEYKYLVNILIRNMVYLHYNITYSMFILPLSLFAKTTPSSFSAVDRRYVCV